MIELTEIRKNIFLVTFDSKYLAAATMMRMQEFYESPLPKIRGEFFTIETFMDVYAEAKGKFFYKDADYTYKGDKNFTYTLDCEAFNVPGHIVRMFWNEFEGRFGGRGLLNKEQKLFDMIFPLTHSLNKFYLIVTGGKEGSGYVAHEVAHAYYYLYPAYRKRMNGLIGKFKRSEEMKKELLSTNVYCESVFRDEIQAYLATSTVKSIKQNTGFRARPNELMAFQKVFNRFDHQLVYGK